VEPGTWNALVKDQRPLLHLKSVAFELGRDYDYPYFKIRRLKS